MDVSFQLYSARNFTPWDQAVETIAGLGYTRVEGFGAVYEDPAGFRALMDRHGVVMPSGHFAFDFLEAEFDAAAEIARTLGISTLYCPVLMPRDRPTDAEGWRVVGRRLEVLGKRADDAGFGFGWHNHDYEFAALADGGIPMQILLDTAPAIGWECDVAWIVRGGRDPLDWIARHGDRITAAHVKDIAPEGQNAAEDGWADLGHGTVDWKAILPALRAAGTGLFVMEHDNPSDLSRFAARSLDTFRTL